jgi:hypothetical protein
MYATTADEYRITRFTNGAYADKFIMASSGDTYFTNSVGIGRAPTQPFDVYASTGSALVYLQNTNTVGYSGIDIFRQGGAHAGSLWCANDTAGANNNRNAITLAARTGGEKVFIVGGGYDPTVTGGITVFGSFIGINKVTPTVALDIVGVEATITGSNAHWNVFGTTSYSYIRFNGNNGSTANDLYLIQNTPGTTSNGVAAGAAYMYFGQGQQMEFNWAGLSKIQFTSTGQATFAGDVIAFSDISVKENIRTIDNVLERVVRSRGILYDRKDTKLKNNIGFIAQELELEFPELISINADGTKGVKYQNATAVLFEAIKELKAEVNDLRSRLDR